MTAYATLAEAIEREILPALGGYAEDFDVRAIADDVLEYVTPEDDQGRLRSGRPRATSARATGGFVLPLAHH